MEEPVRSRSDHYAEAAPARALATHVSRVWTRQVAGDGEQTGRIVPDGCMDIIWGGGSLSVAGPDTGPFFTPLRPGMRLVALRFRPGAAPTALGTPASHLRDRRVDLEALWGADARRLHERLGDCPDDAAVARELQRAVAGRLPGTADPLVEGVVGATRVRPYDTAPLSVTTLADRLGYSERQLRRRCLAAFGYGPATLRRVLRFHRAFTLSRSGRCGSHAELAAALGYTDQAHLARDVRDLAGTTLTRLAGDGGASG